MNDLFGYSAEIKATDIEISLEKGDAKPDMVVVQMKAMFSWYAPFHPRFGSVVVVLVVAVVVVVVVVVVAVAVAVVVVVVVVVVVAVVEVEVNDVVVVVELLVVVVVVVVVVVEYTAFSLPHLH